RIQRCGSFKRGDGRVVLVAKREDNTEAGVSEGQIRVELYSLARQLVGLVEGTRIEKVTVKRVNPGGIVSPSQNGVAARIVCVDLKGLLDETPRSVKVLLVEQRVERG